MCSVVLKSDASASEKVGSMCYPASSGSIWLCALRLCTPRYIFARPRQCAPRHSFVSESRFSARAQVQYLHPKDGVYPEKVNPGRSVVNANSRRIGANPNPVSVRPAP